MKRFLSVLSIAFGMLSYADCSDLANIMLPDVTVTEVVHADEPAPHCKLTGRIGREIGFSVWLPDTWNGRFLMGGAGGFAGSIQGHALGMGALERGYATAGTDTGHQANGIDGSWALDNLERIVNYGHVAIHRTTEVAKAVITSHYVKGIERSFFAGCSNGGRQALGFAQRYPNDFQGIIAGAPALDFPGVAAGFTAITQKMYPDASDLSKPILTESDRKHVASKILAACDADDGIEDGIMNDPRKCDFDVASLDLPADKIAAVRAVYDGPTSKAGRLYHGYPFGGEDEAGGWGAWLAGAGDEAGIGLPSAGYGFGIGFMRYFLFNDPDWSYVGYDFNDYAKRTQPLAAVLNANDPDLSAFRDAGGKLLIYHGWSDAALSALSTIAYVEDVYALDASARDDVRLFLLPGVLHCAGGPGPDTPDYLTALETWDRTDAAPDTLVANFRDGSGGRTVCAYPTSAEYLGGGERDPSRFACR